MSAAARVDADAAAYLRSVERTFVQAVGRGLMLSARDIERVLRWARADYPLHIVNETIEQTMKLAPPRVRGLAYVAPAVEEAVRVWQRRREGEPLDAQPPRLANTQDAWQGLLDRLVAVGRAADEPARSVLRLAWRLSRQVQERCTVDPTLDPVRLLAQAESEVEVFAIESLEVTVRAMIEARVDLSLAAERRIAAPEAFAETRRAQVWRAVRKRLKVPQLKLTYTEGAAR
jgi:hypothetical protein